MTKTQWSVSDISESKYIGLIEFQDNSGEWYNFELLETKDKLIFGGSTNNTYLESGYILREDGESLDETLQEMTSDLETYYNDGPQFVSRIVCNERM